MAFVNRSERDLKLSLFESNAIGPGQYNKGNHLLLYPSQLQVPFNVGGRKFSAISKTESSIGPGSYDIKPNQNKSFNRLICNDPFTNNIDDNSNSNHNHNHRIKRKIAFDTAERRFKHEYGNDSPGPGEYEVKPEYSNSNNQNRGINSALKYNGNNIIGSPYRIVSIPSRDNPYGYQITDQGIMKMANQADTLSIFANSNDSLIKPIALNQSSSNNKLKHQYKTNNDICPNKQNLLKSITITTTNRTHSNSKMNTIENTSIDQKDYEYQPQRKKAIEHKRQYIRKRIMNQGSNNNNNNDKDVIDSFCLLNPGPGYYFSEFEHNNMLDLKHKHNSRYQKFGSNAPRDMSTDNSKAKLLGPGQYDIIDKFNVLGYSGKTLYYQPQIVKYSNNNLEKVKKERQLNDTLIGPGYYEPHQDTRNSQSKVSIFQSNQERFSTINKKNDDSPGPGSYELFNKAKLIENEKKYRTNLTSTEGKRVIGSKMTPGVGTYNPEIYKSIEYSAYSKAKNSTIPLYSQQRKEDKNNNIQLGPGYYDPYPINKDIKANDKAPFLSNVNRFNSKITDKTHANDKGNMLGPGKYNPSSYHDWIKKTYNVLFV